MNFFEFFTFLLKSFIIDSYSHELLNICDKHIIILLSNLVMNMAQESHK